MLLLDSSVIFREACKSPVSGIRNGLQFLRSILLQSEMDEVFHTAGQNPNHLWFREHPSGTSGWHRTVFLVSFFLYWFSCIFCAEDRIFIQLFVLCILFIDVINVNVLFYFYDLFFFLSQISFFLFLKNFLLCSIWNLKICIWIMLGADIFSYCFFYWNCMRAFYFEW